MILYSQVIIILIHTTASAIANKRALFNQQGLADLSMMAWAENNFKQTSIWRINSYIAQESCVLM